MRTTVDAILLLFSILSWTIVFGKWSRFRAARRASSQFLRAFRKAGSLQPVALAMDKSGALLIADDVGGTVWRVTGAAR